MTEDFRGKDEGVNVVLLFNVDGWGTFRLVRRGELSQFRPTETTLEWRDEREQRWVRMGTVGVLQAHPRVRDLMDL